MIYNKLQINTFTDNCCHRSSHQYYHNLHDDDDDDDYNDVSAKMLQQHFTPSQCEHITDVDFLITIQIARQTAKLT